MSEAQNQTKGEAGRREASELSGLLCCPHCQGESGYEYKRVERWLMYSAWDGEETGEADQIMRENKPRCRDCGRIVPAR